MERMIVCAFNSRRDADTARRRLLDNGFDDARIRVEGGEAAPTASVSAYATEHPGLAGVIERMFSGILMDDDVTRYAHAARKGQSVIAFRAPDDAAAASAASVLSEISSEIEASCSSTAAQSKRSSDLRDAEMNITTIPGPRIYPLPNAPTGWSETTRGERSSIGNMQNDPGRPTGLLHDATSPGTDTGRDVINEKTPQDSKHK